MTCLLIYIHDYFYREFIKSVLCNLYINYKIVDSLYECIRNIASDKYFILIVDEYNLKQIYEIKKYISEQKKVKFIYISKNGNIDHEDILYIQRPIQVEDLFFALSQVFTSLKTYNLSQLVRLKPPYVIGNSQSIQNLRCDIQKISETDFSVLIQGETGTGKGVVAKAVHANSKRHDKKYMEINCATLPHNLMESELFGYTQGAFTGALKNRQGKFESVSNGTLFLDEIAEMVPAMQSKLLQVLQDGQFSPLGGHSVVDVDIRVLSATNADLKKLLEHELFRMDLFYRLAVMTVYVPPLKDRREDIVPLTVYFLEHFAHKYQKSALTLSSELWDLLFAYHWPGNVRELENLLNSYVALENEDIVYEYLQKRVDNRLQLQEINTDDYINRIATQIDINNVASLSLKDITSKVAALAEQSLIQEALEATQGSKKKAAKLLRLSYKSLLTKAKEYNIYT